MKHMPIKPWYIDTRHYGLQIRLAAGSYRSDDNMLVYMQCWQAVQAWLMPWLDASSFYAGLTGRAGATYTSTGNWGLCLASESAAGSAGVPPIVETTASTSSIDAKAFAISSFTRASPLTTMAIMPSMADLQEVLSPCCIICHAPLLSTWPEGGALPDTYLRPSLLWRTQTHDPMSFNLRVTSSATPPPPQTKMLALSGSSAACVFHLLLPCSLLGLLNY